MALQDSNWRREENEHFDTLGSRRMVDTSLDAHSGPRRRAPPHPPEVFSLCARPRHH